MAAQLTLDGMDQVIRQEIGRKLLQYMVTNANICVRELELTPDLHHPAAIVDRASSRAAHDAWSSAAARVAAVCGLELRRE